MSKRYSFVTYNCVKLICEYLVTLVVFHKCEFRLSSKASYAVLIKFKIVFTHIYILTSTYACLLSYHYSTQIFNSGSVTISQLFTTDSTNINKLVILTTIL